MVVVMGTDATPEQIDAVVARVTDQGGDAFVSRGVSRTIIGLIGDVDQFHSLDLNAMPGVADVVRISSPVQAGEPPTPPADVDGVCRGRPCADRA